MVVTRENYKAVIKYLSPGIIEEIEAMPEGQNLPESERLRLEVIVVNAYYRRQIGIMMENVNKRA